MAVRRYPDCDDVNGQEVVCVCLQKSSAVSQPRSPSSLLLCFGQMSNMPAVEEPGVTQSTSAE